MARAVFNEEPSILSARLFAGVLRRLFGDGSRAAALMRPAVGLSRLYVDPAVTYLSARGGELHSSWPVERVRADSGGFTIEGRSQSVVMRTVCLAVPAEQAARLLGPECTDRIPHLADAAAVDSAPLTTVHLWLEGATPALAEPFVGFVDGDFAWAFDAGAHGAFRQIALVAPGSRALAAEPSHRIIRQARQTLAAHEPLLAERGLHDARVVKEPHAAPSLTPEAARARPGAETSVPGLALAGDWTDTGLPATLEGAAMSGHRAAAALDRYLSAC
jgi:predicted NAD/FAD-dependent oxidoreductase